MLPIALLLLQLGSAQAELPIPEHEREILLGLFEATGGASWADREGWRGAVGTECDWFGVGCFENIDGDPAPHVVAIDLPRNNLTGSVPSQLADLPFLVALDLSDNPVALPLPESLIDRWDRGDLDLKAGAGGLPLDEIRLRVRSEWSCAAEEIILRRDGTALSYRDRCRTPGEENPHSYCELRSGKTWEFQNAERFLERSGFFQPFDPSAKGTAGGMITVMVRGSKGIRSVSPSSDAVDMQDFWTYEKVIRGVAQEIEWSDPIDGAQCPWPCGWRGCG